MVVIKKFENQIFRYIPDVHRILEFPTGIAGLLFNIYNRPQESNPDSPRAFIIPP